jgi:hypothetical protein
VLSTKKQVSTSLEYAYSPFEKARYHAVKALNSVQILSGFESTGREVEMVFDFPVGHKSLNHVLAPSFDRF